MDGIVKICVPEFDSGCKTILELIDDGREPQGSYFISCPIDLRVNLRAHGRARIGSTANGGLFHKDIGHFGEPDWGL